MKNFLFIFTLLVLSACSFKSLVMPNLDYFIVSRIDKNLGLYGEQEDQVKNEIQKLLKDNVEMAKLFREDILKLDPENLDPAKGYETLKSRYITLSEQVSAIMAKQIAHFDEKQIKQFFEINRDKNEELQERIKEIEIKDYYGRYEFFLGELNQKQKDLLKSKLSLFKDLSRERLQNRLETQNKMQDIFRLQDKKQKEKEIYALFLSASTMPSTPNRRQAIQLFGEILRLLDSTQIKYFEEKRQEWVEWLDYYIKYFSSK
ncbi:MAG: hypothetical protein EP319_08130 [Deltaproteobacteria bacterium]|nr:MAG: hypothetical protein EP319_08130 [Deltaproteobacteria bacterium]